MGRKFARVLCIAVCVALMLAAIYFICAFFGNPISAGLAKRSANNYLLENFQETDFELHNVGYDLKTGGYFVHVQSPTSIDSHFTIYFDALGRYKYDTSSSISDGSNTFTRLNEEYWDLVKARLPYQQFDIDIGFGDLRAAGRFEIYDYIDEKGVRKHHTLTKDYGLDMSTLVLDGQYDILALGRDHGSLCVYIQDEDISVERAAQVLLELKAQLDRQELPFHAIDFVLCTPRNEDGMRQGPSIRLIEFLYCDIYEEGLTDRIQENWTITKEHYAIQDGLKKETELLVPYFVEIPEETN